MPQFRKIRVVVEAIQYIADGSSIAGLHFSPEGTPFCQTLEGPLHVTLGDWIVRGIDGEYYPCKPDIFTRTFEPVPEIK